MRKDLPIDILSAVEKPARYTGMEFGSIVKPEEETEVSFCLAFPDTYEIGMSYLGFKILYEILNKLTGVAAERAFAPWVDMEAKMRERGLVLSSLENTRPLKDFDLLGFTLLYEMSYSNILNMLDLGGVPILAKDRTLDDPFVCAGGCCVFNSEPLADFLDFCMLGDGERIIQEVTLLYRDWKREGKPGGRLGFLRRVSGSRESTSLPSMKSPTGRTVPSPERNPWSPRHRKWCTSGRSRIWTPWISPPIPLCPTATRSTTGSCWNCSGAAAGAAGSATPGSSTGRSGNGNRKR